MGKKIGRNDPCPCGSGKKYKQCCFLKQNTPKKFKAKLLSKPKQEKMPNLMERTFGQAIEKGKKEEKPPKS